MNRKISDCAGISLETAIKQILLLYICCLGQVRGFTRLLVVIKFFVVGMLNVISEELEDCPLYYVIDKLANVIHCSVPSMLQFRSALITLGYRVSSTHANSNGLKTNAPNDGMIFLSFPFFSECVFFIFL